FSPADHSGSVFQRVAIGVVPALGNPYYRDTLWRSTCDDSAAVSFASGRRVTRLVLNMLQNHHNAAHPRLLTAKAFLAPALVLVVVFALRIRTEAPACKAGLDWIVYPPVRSVGCLVELVCPDVLRSPRSRSIL